MSFFELAWKKHLTLVVVLVLTSFQLIRIIAFVRVYGGVEHDGGWALTISRSLAERGTYTTTVSTIVDPAVPGGINIDQKFDIQVPDGSIWFRSSSVTGPASIVPDALVLKIFGTNFWGLVTGPLIFYILFLLLAALILYQLAGIGAVILFHLFLFFYPHISIFLSYQALGEVPSMVYILWAYLAFTVATQKKQQRWLHFLIAGLIVGLAVNAKLITMWSISGVFVWAGVLWLVGQKNSSYVVNLTFRFWNYLPKKLLHDAGNFADQRSSEKLSNPGIITGEQKLRFKEVFSLGSGMAIVLILWELIQWAILVWLTNFEMYLQYMEQRLDEVLDQGSGVRLRVHSSPEFFWDKFFRLDEVAHPHRWVTAIIFVAIFLGGLFLLWRWGNRHRRQNLLAPIWIGWLVNTIWFVSLAKTGWPRHFWFGLVLAVMLSCVVSVTLVQMGIERHRSKRDKWGLSLFASIAGMLFLALIGWGFISQPHVWGFFLQDELIPYWQEKQINDKYGASLPWIIISRADQDEIVSYLQQLPPEAHVYYPFQHKAAEISALTGQIFYPFDRRELMGVHPRDVAIIGPSLIAPWMEPGRRQVLRDMVGEECPQPIVANDYYMICPIEANLSP